MSMIVVPVSLRKGKAVVVPGRVELPTSTLSVWRSNQLSYRTVFITSVVETFDGCRIQKGSACLLSVSVTVSLFFYSDAAHWFHPTTSASRKEVFFVYLA